MAPPRSSIAAGSARSCSGGRPRRPAAAGSAAEGVGVDQRPAAGCSIASSRPSRPPWWSGWPWLRTTAESSAGDSRTAAKLCSRTDLVRPVSNRTGARPARSVRDQEGDPVLGPRPAARARGSKCSNQAEPLDPRLVRQQHVDRVLDDRRHREAVDGGAHAPTSSASRRNSRARAAIAMSIMPPSKTVAPAPRARPGRAPRPSPVALDLLRRGRELGVDQLRVRGVDHVHAGVAEVAVLAGVAAQRPRGRRRRPRCR